MPDEHGLITRLLNIAGLSNEWHVLPADPNDFLSIVTIENKAGHIVALPISTRDVADLADWILIGRIRTAIADTTRPSSP